MKLPPSSVLAPIALAGLSKVSVSAINSTFKESHMINTKPGGTHQDENESKIDTGILGRVASRKIGQRGANMLFAPARRLHSMNTTSNPEESSDTYSLCPECTPAAHSCSVFCHCMFAYIGQCYEVCDYDSYFRSIFSCMADGCMDREVVDECQEDLYLQYYCPGNPFPDCVLNGGSLYECFSKQYCQSLLDESHQDTGGAQNQSYVECCNARNEANYGWDECFEFELYEPQGYNETASNVSVGTTAVGMRLPVLASSIGSTIEVVGAEGTSIDDSESGGEAYGALEEDRQSPANSSQYRTISSLVFVAGVISWLVFCD